MFKKLLDLNAITQKEYNIMKKEILNLPDNYDLKVEKKSYIGKSIKRKKNNF